MTATTYIQDHPPADGKQYDCQCARCGSSCDWTECEEYDCDDGYITDDADEWDDDDGVPGEVRVCDTCEGRGGWNTCLSSAKFCEDNPLPGREAIRRGALEWFEVGDEG